MLSFEITRTLFKSQNNLAEAADPIADHVLHHGAPPWINRQRNSIFSSKLQSLIERQEFLSTREILKKKFWNDPKFGFQILQRPQVWEVFKRVR